MITDKDLEKKLKDYLEKKQEVFYPDSINYVSLRNIMQIDGSFKKMHIVSYMVSTSNQPYDGDALYSAAFDEKTLKLEFIVGPQSLEIIK
ncbi:hypothetical protein EG347_15510 [Chryseobacterium sp. G0186]|uniref:hypothetical protein n=1 Tax=Chryseobacterium sp. G0186 TaxID=2487064 RepID=UPI000F4E1D0F|nr:hypothetical protein [Chryseobacterium sp. G0186]AZA78814.1 hypothetical protein EG347_15510 [Chryseobacterium sp. G0186]